MAAQAKKMKVFSFEMDPLNNSIQHYNVFKNNLQALIATLPIALSDQNSIRNVYYKSISPGDTLHSIDDYSPYISNENRSKVQTSKIAMFSLDFLIDELDLAFPAHKKIDVDGIEFKILQGMPLSLKSALSIMIEVDSESIESIKEYLSAHGFILSRIFSAHGVRKDNTNALFIKH